MSHTIVIAATGLAQPRKLSNGLATIRSRILSADPVADVRCFSWKEYAKIPDLSADIRRAWTEESRLVMAGHSWGGWFVCRLASELQLRVSAMLLADPVDRPPSATLTIPSNVARLFVWRQVEGIIKGSDLAVSSKTVWEVDETVQVHHPFVDEVQSFQDAVVREATA